jgi:hypothetical protein
MKWRNRRLFTPIVFDMLLSIGVLIVSILALWYILLWLFSSGTHK